MEVILMKLIYKSDHKTYRLNVEKSPDEHYFLVFERLTLNNSGNRSTLDSFELVDSAIKASKHFPKMYKIAQEKGYTLSGKEFVNQEGRRVHVSLALDLDATPEYFASLL
jgi:hypothetical protein